MSSRLRKRASERKRERDLRALTAHGVTLREGKLSFFMFFFHSYSDLSCASRGLFLKDMRVCVKERRLANKSAVISCLASRLVQLSRNIHREKVHREIYCKREWTVVI